MMLSYSFETRITSGYLKGTPSANIISLVEHDLRECARSAVHPLLLPILYLCRQLSLDNDMTQRNCRDEVRKLEERLLNRYRDPAAVGAAENHEVILEATVSKLYDNQCQVLWKRPQTWQCVVSRIKEGNLEFRDSLSEQQRQDPSMQMMDQTIKNRLDFLEARLINLAGYTQVTLERMDMLRGLVSYRRGLVSGCHPGPNYLSVRTDQYDDRANRVDVQPRNSGRD